MDFSRVVGQTTAVESLGKFGGFQSSLMIEGPQGSGKGFLAYEFAKNFTDESYIKVIKSGSKITVTDARELVRWVQIKTFTGDRKIIIIEDAHRVSEGIMNIFLKAVEEGYGSWIFTTEDSRYLLDTIVSRCFRVRTSQFSEDSLFKIAKSWGYINSDSKEAAEKAHGSVRFMNDFLEGYFDDVEELVFSLTEDVKRRKVGRLFRDLVGFRGEKARGLSFTVLDSFLSKGLKEGWPTEEVMKVVKASESLKAGEAPYLCMVNLLLGLRI